MTGRGVAVVVEDDDDVRASLAAVLTQSGFDVRPASSAGKGVAAVAEYHPVVVTMDVGLPDFDGIQAARQIRSFSTAYLIMVTRLGAEADTVVGLEAGADDYLTKPFSPAELQARVRAMLRRPLVPLAAENASPAALNRGGGPAPAASSLPVFDFEHRGLQIHEGTRTVQVDGEYVGLTRAQFDLLLVLMENGRQVQTKADLVHRLRNEPYGSASYVSSAQERAVEVHIRKLRSRLGDNARHPRWVETVRGVGYRLTP